MRIFVVSQWLEHPLKMGREFADRLLLKKLNLVHRDYITVLLRIMYLGEGRKPSLGPLIWLGNFGVLDKWSFLGSGGTWRFDCNYTSLLSGFLSHRHGTVKPPLMVTSTMATSLSSVSKVAIEERFNCIFSWILLTTIRSKFFFLFIGLEPITWPANNCVKIMVCSCAMPSNCVWLFVWLQIIFCTCVKVTVLFSFLRSLSRENGRSLRFRRIFIKKTNSVIEW